LSLSLQDKKTKKPTTTVEIIKYLHVTKKRKKRKKRKKKKEEGFRVGKIKAS